MEAIPLVAGGGGGACGGGGAGHNRRAERAHSRARTALAAAALLLLPTLYLLTRPQHRLLPYLHLPPSTSPPAPPTHPDFLVWSSACRIPDIDPHSSEAMAQFVPQKYLSCSTGLAYTYMQENDGGHSVIHVNETLLNKTKSKGDKVSCCYVDIIRKNDSSQLIKSNCKKIDGSVTLLDSEEFIMTKCTVNFNKGRMHEKTHDTVFLNVQPSVDLKQRLQSFSQKNNPNSSRVWNVLIVGIDTLSRINLIRAMPKTYKLLKEHDWLDFQGYNKIDDNTYPNLMAILTGRNQSRARKLCDGSGANSPDNCDFMWKEYERVGYVTAYAEDDVGIDTFEKPYHKGFTRKPTDHYLRPVYQMVEKNIHKSKGSVYCSGQVTSGELLFQYALNFVNKYKNDPFFGFFWANTFSHNDIGSPSSMDEKVAEFFDDLKNTGTLDKTFVWFISDHGIRYGKMRSLISGYYEERLPAMYVSIPKDFKNLHPNEYNSLRLNTKRLTTPYDVYMTLQDILYLSRRKEVLISSEACPACQSLFQEVPVDRACEECAVHPHWCTCNPLKPLPSNHELANRAVNFVLDKEIEDVLKTVNIKCRKCAKLKLDKIIRIHEYDYIHKSNDSVDFLIAFSTKPEMVFETTVKFNNTSQTFVTEGIISRLSGYSGTGHCVSTAYLKKFCHCLKRCIK